MFHPLKRHHFPVDADFDFTLALTFALPADDLRPLLYPGLELDEYDGLGFIAVAMVQTRKLRPSGLPKFLGRDFFLTGYRIFVRHQTPEGRRLRGLQVLRSDTDSNLMFRLGNLFTHYKYEKAEVSVISSKERASVQVTTPSGKGNLGVHAFLDQSGLPANSPFPNEAAARRFAGPMPFTFSYEEETDSIIRVKGVRSNWHPKLVQAQVTEAAFLTRFEHQPILASAFYLQKIPYRWERGVVTKVFKEHKTHTDNSGVGNIIKFNWPQFAAAGVFSAAALTASRSKKLPDPVRKVARIAAEAALVQTFAALFVSYYVYDLSQLTKWRWLTTKLPTKAKKILNIHSGFDETTIPLRSLLPQAEVISVDLFDPLRMTEPSIRRARRSYPPLPDAIPGSVNHLPFEDGEADVVLLIFSAHEFRYESERRMLFREAARVLKPGGVLFLVEHLKDLPNMLAFGPGALHFFSEKTWRKDASVAFSSVNRTGAVTPFVRWFEFALQR